MKIIIAGGGIGGLVAALCFHQAGFEVQVYESVKKMKPLGVGINLLPHSVRILTKLGLADKLAAIAIETKELVYANRHGQLFWEEARGRYAGYKWPQFSIHRGHLQMLLYKEVMERLGAMKVLANHHLQQFEQHENGIKATFIERDTGKLQSIVEGDLLVGADGIHSVVRQQLYPTEGAVKYSGNVLYRGTTMMPSFLTGASMVMIGHNQQKMVAYPIQKPLADGRQLVNWVSNLKEAEDYKLRTRDWNRQANKERLLALYQDWTFDWLDVPAMIEGAERIYEFPMSDRDPLPSWTFGRVTLLGDAAHPMYPIGSNGASQAILDADELSLALQEERDLMAALERYDQVRVPATAKVVLQNRKKGPDSIMDLMENRFPNGFNQTEIPHEELDAIMEKYKQIAGFDIESLNRKS